jgi:rod shape-determining protein MreC
LRSGGNVKKPVGSISHVTTPVRAWLHRFAFILLVASAFGLMLLGKADTVLVERARTAVTDAVTPLLDLASRPVSTINAMIDDLQEVADLRAENASLRRENERLRNWQSVAQRIEAENTALRQLVNMVPDPGLRFVTARVIGDPGGAFARSVLVNAGERDGVTKGEAAVTSAGLAGRVAEVGLRSARVLLVTDINSRIPVLVGAGRDRAVLAGDNTAQPKLLYLAPEVEVQPGDRVVTSGHGGVFPPGLPVGVVTEAGEAGLRVAPHVDWAHMEYLRLADYDLPGLLLSVDGQDVDKTVRGSQRAER